MGGHIHANPRECRGQGKPLWTWSYHMMYHPRVLCVYRRGFFYCISMVVSIVTFSRGLMITESLRHLWNVLLSNNSNNSTTPRGILSLTDTILLKQSHTNLRDISSSHPTPLGEVKIEHQHQKVLHSLIMDLAQHEVSEYSKQVVWFIYLLNRNCSEPQPTQIIWQAPEQFFVFNKTRDHIFVHVDLEVSTPISSD